MPDEAMLALERAHTVLVVDWRSTDVPDTLVRAGCAVVVKGAPNRIATRVRELNRGEVVSRKLTDPPQQVDLVNCHRPVQELFSIAALAKALGARMVWRQSGLDRDGRRHPKGCWAPREEAEQARDLVESADLIYVDDRYIADVVRQVRRG